MTEKTSKNKTGKNFYYMLLEHVTIYGKLPDMGITKQALNYHVKYLKSLGILIKIGYGVWNVDEEKYKEFKENYISKNKSKPSIHTGTWLKKNIRGHGFSFTIEIPKIKSWKYRTSWLSRLNMKYKMVGKYKNVPRIIIDTHKVWLSKDSIVIYFDKDRSYFSKDAFLARKYAINDMFRVLRQIENMLQISFRMGRGYQFKVSKQHYGKIQDEIATLANKENIKIRLKGSDNKEWLLIDNSFNLNELETTHPETSHKDMDNIIKPMLNDWKNTYDQTGEVITNSGLAKQISNLIQTTNLIAEQNKETAAGLKAVVDILRIQIQPKDSYNNDNKIKPKYVG